MKVERSTFECLSSLLFHQLKACCASAVTRMFHKSNLVNSIVTLVTVSISRHTTDTCRKKSQLYLKYGKLEHDHV